jgi:hypothetical protein
LDRPNSSAATTRSGAWTPLEFGQWAEGRRAAAGFLPIRFGNLREVGHGIPSCGTLPSTSVIMCGKPLVRFVADLFHPVDGLAIELFYQH